MLGDMAMASGARTGFTIRVQAADFVAVRQVIAMCTSLSKELAPR